MSLTALSLVLANAALYGVDHEAEDGAAVQMFQILMVGQIPLLIEAILRGTLYLNARSLLQTRHHISVTILKHTLVCNRSSTPMRNH